MTQKRLQFWQYCCGIETEEDQLERKTNKLIETKEDQLYREMNELLDEYVNEQPSSIKTVAVSASLTLANIALVILIIKLSLSAWLVAPAAIVSINILILCQFACYLKKHSACDRSFADYLNYCADGEGTWRYVQIAAQAIAHIIALPVILLTFICRIGKYCLHDLLIDYQREIPQLQRSIKGYCNHARRHSIGQAFWGGRNLHYDSIECVSINVELSIN